MKKTIFHLLLRPPLSLTILQLLPLLPLPLSKTIKQGAVKAGCGRLREDKLSCAGLQREDLRLLVPSTAKRSGPLLRSWVRRSWGIQYSSLKEPNNINDPRFAKLRLRQKFHETC